jgi:hypothetical protein
MLEKRIWPKRKQSTFERLTSGKLNRKQRKDLGRRLRADDPGLEIVHRNVGGIDVGNQSHYVAVAPACDAEPVREFGSWTADLVRMAEWLKLCGIQQVVLQSTGVYWIAVYDYWRRRDSRFASPTPGTRKTCRGERATCRRASG